MVHAGLSSSDGTLPLQGVGALGHSADMTQTGVALRHHTPASAHPSVSVPTVDFATVLLGVRALLGRSANGKKIVMKMDLEAEEYRVFPHLIRRSALCELDVVYVEWHPKVCSKKEPEGWPQGAVAQPHQAPSGAQPTAVRFAPDDTRGDGTGLPHRAPRP